MASGTGTLGHLFDVRHVIGVVYAEDPLSGGDAIGGSPVVTSDTQGHEFVVEIGGTPTDSQQGNKFIVAIDAIEAHGNEFTVSLEVSDTQGNEFAVSLETLDTLGHRFAVFRGTVDELGHKFAVELETTSIQGNNFTVPIHTSSRSGHEFFVHFLVSPSQGHYFAVQQTTLDARGNEYAVALTVDSTQGHQFFVAIDAIDTQGHRFTPALVGISSLGYSFRVPRRAVRANVFSDEDQDLLSADLGITRTEPNKVVTPAQPITEEPEAIDPLDRLKQGKKKYENWLKAAEQMKKIIGNRLKDRKVKVNATQNLALRDAIRRVFGKDTDIITYEMFQQALEIRSQMIEEERKKNYGSANTGSSDGSDTTDGS